MSSILSAIMLTLTNLFKDYFVWHELLIGFLIPYLGIVFLFGTAYSGKMIKENTLLGVTYKIFSIIILLGVIGLTLIVVISNVPNEYSLDDYVPFIFCLIGLLISITSFILNTQVPKEVIVGD